MKCRHCKQPDDGTLTADCVIRDRGKIYTYFTCRSCNTARNKLYRTTPTGKAAIYRAARNYGAKNPERRRAWRLAQRKIDKKPCVVCGDLNTHRHHPNIDEPLRVIFLCPLHHKQIERK